MLCLASISPRRYRNKIPAFKSRPQRKSPAAGDGRAFMGLPVRRAYLASAFFAGWSASQAMMRLLAAHRRGCRRHRSLVSMSLNEAMPPSASAPPSTMSSYWSQIARRREAQIRAPRLRTGRRSRGRPAQLREYRSKPLAICACAGRLLAAARPAGTPSGASGCTVCVATDLEDEQPALIGLVLASSPIWDLEDPPARPRRPSRPARATYCTPSTV